MVRPDSSTTHNQCDPENHRRKPRRFTSVYNTTEQLGHSGELTSKLRPSKAPAPSCPKSARRSSRSLCVSSVNSENDLHRGDFGFRGGPWGASLCLKWASVAWREPPCCSGRRIAFEPFNPGSSQSICLCASSALGRSAARVADSVSLPKCFRGNNHEQHFCCR